MGTYDHVEIKIECPKCGKIISGFQTKDGPRQFLYLRPGLTFDRWWMDKPDDCYHNREFHLIAYGYCECKYLIKEYLPYCLSKNATFSMLNILSSQLSIGCNSLFVIMLIY